MHVLFTHAQYPLKSKRILNTPEELNVLPWTGPWDSYNHHRMGESGHYFEAMLLSNYRPGMAIAARTYNNTHRTGVPEYVSSFRATPPLPQDCRYAAVKTIVTRVIHCNCISSILIRTYMINIVRKFILLCF